MEPEELKSLREAVRNSPENIALRKYFSKQLIKLQKFEEAELELKEVLKLSQTDIEAKLDLCEVFRKQEKNSAALVLIESINTDGNFPAKGWILYARVLLQNKQIEDAEDAYQKALIINPALEDIALEKEIKDSKKGNISNEPQKIKLGAEDEGDFSDPDIEKPQAGFEQVGGMEKIKSEISKKIIYPLKHPEIYQAYGKKTGGGILMYGPPGCGKTHLARATAGEINASFISVGINDILDLYLGQSERNLHAIFEKARRLNPGVLFFDEVDALGASRSDMRQSAGRQLINQFLSELDGVEYSNEGVLILAATNAPWHLDSAFRRPGRFDRIIFIPPPDEEARKVILDIHLKNKPVEKIDFAKIAKATHRYSGADLKAIVDIAIESKLDESMEQGRPVPITTKDLMKAANQHKSTTTEWFETAKNYALFANESGLYDEIIQYLKIKK
ncbi:AAA family ATPase [Chondrinema litorale]|uniref:AAA family ATPase n=1 Tax=Chondrinema litorale TaxID=2994555 RepID=UPI002543E788|nr:AAA family ATPase [Chondrinema litorale]UZR93506.1 AAA family ATPase [Chondrinema litorale]